MSQEYDQALVWAHPVVQTWFLAQFGSPTEPQMQGWPSILAGHSTLISAPTGSGKTLAAFLICIDRLVRAALQGELADQTQVLYVSPLKALSNDIQKNLMKPLAEIAELAKQQGLTMTPIRVAVRTGDTPTKDRQAMLKKPPHILVTTPESFYILLTAEKSRVLLQSVNTVIVDEIHALANNKRGSHLTLSLERLEVLCDLPLVRIGLSATQKPIALVGEYLVGNRSPPTLVNVGHAKHLQLAIEVPNMELGAVASNDLWLEVYDRLAQLATQNRSTLIFVNTRRLAERIAHHLTERLGEGKVLAHHGSLSRKLRLHAETMLKEGQLQALVATASLELGIDIGTIDLVCQIGSPRAIAIALQRVGRAGHWRDAISCGRFFVTTRDELLECSALIHAITEGDLDQLIIPKQPLDILAQQIVATCATGEWSTEALFALVTRAYPYQQLSRQSFDEVITLLSEGIAGTRGRYGVYLFHDQINDRIKGRRGARLTAITNGGAIPDNGLFTVIAEPQGVMVGTLDEDFAIESSRGDIILLGTTAWRISHIESRSGRVIVQDAPGMAPSVPFWRGEAPARTQELSFSVANLRQTVSDLLPATLQQLSEAANSEAAMEATEWLQQHGGVNASGAAQIIAYILQGRALLGGVPTQRFIIAERFFDESGGMQLVIHAPFGARINKAWGLALRKRFCKSFNFELQAAATDDGLNIALAEQHSFPLGDVFHFLHPNTVIQVLTQAVLQSPLFNTRWRWDATRALALTRFRYGKKVPPNIQRMLADDLLAAVFPDAAACQDNLGGRDLVLPDHPLIQETMHDALTEALDSEGLIEVLKGIASGAIQTHAVDTPMPSVFSHEILNANPYAFLDDAPLEERRARATQLRRIMPQAMLNEVGQLDSAAILTVQQQAWPDIRDSDELHDLLQTVMAIPKTLSLSQGESIPWEVYLPELIAQRRVGVAQIEQQVFWFAIEKQYVFKALYPDATLSPNPLTSTEKPDMNVSREEALIAILRGWLFQLGPTTSAQLSAFLLLPLEEVDAALLSLEVSGVILRGHFASALSGQVQWCERRLLARIHHLTVSALRQQIKPVTTVQFMDWLLTWQHVQPNTQLQGEQGLLEVIRQLQGYELPANAWERQIFAKRIVHYDSSLLDRLCASGLVAWGRLSPRVMKHSAEIQDKSMHKRINPTRIVPITFFIREDVGWMNSIIEPPCLDQLGHVACDIYRVLQTKGALFLSDIVHEVHALKSEIETGLWELVATGLVTADSFNNLRALMDRKRRSKRHRQSPLAGGRWALLNIPKQQDSTQHVEALCCLLLKRYGVVFRDLLVREKNLPAWHVLLPAFRRLEDRGEIRGGRFVEGFRGEQFALPHAVESLRMSRQSPPEATAVSLCAVDPLNLAGIVLSGPRITAISNNKLVLQKGALV